MLDLLQIADGLLEGVFGVDVQMRVLGVLWAQLLRLVPEVVSFIIIIMVFDLQMLAGLKLELLHLLEGRLVLSLDLFHHALLVVQLLGGKPCSGVAKVHLVLMLDGSDAMSLERFTVTVLLHAVRAELKVVLGHQHFVRLLAI